jgi:nucleoside-diphosphate-sugar epimerase
MQAAKALSLDSPLAGNAYFITNADPQPFWRFTGDILEGLGYDRPSIRLPASLLYWLACLVSFVIWLLGRLGVKVRPSEFSPTRILLASANRNLSCRRATRDFGYLPQVPIKDALDRTLAHFHNLHRVASSTKAD